MIRPDKSGLAYNARDRWVVATWEEAQRDPSTRPSLRSGQMPGRDDNLPKRGPPPLFRKC